MGSGGATSGYQMTSGGDGSGLFKSVDSGDTWVELTGKGGLPEQVGKIGVSVSPADPERVYALVEAAEGGLYRSDDAGESWTRVNDDHVLTERTAYYAHVFADSQDREMVYVLNAPFLKSTDVGATFERIRPRHGDNHDPSRDSDPGPVVERRLSLRRPHAGGGAGPRRRPPGRSTCEAAHRES